MNISDDVRKLRSLVDLQRVWVSEGSEIWLSCKESCFRILYWAPPHFNICLARLKVAEYLPFFEAFWPDCLLVNRILDDVRHWLDDDSAVPCLPSEDFPDNIKAHQPSFISSLIYLVLATRAAKKSPLNVVSHCVNSLSELVMQKQTNVWIADDPLAHKAWERQNQLLSLEDADNDSEITQAKELKEIGDTLKHRGLFDNLASKAVFVREWNRLADGLSELASKFPIRHDQSELENCVRKWIANAMEVVELLGEKAQ